MLIAYLVIAIVFYIVAAVQTAKVLKQRHQKGFCLAIVMAFVCLAIALIWPLVVAEEIGRKIL